jgi:OPA family glycerol-3-phosphate transporter-like MFS transporter 3
VREQVKVYLITYIGYALIHFERVFWSMSKYYIKTGKYGEFYTTKILSRFDFAELISYSFFLYLSGIIGDSFDQRKVLTLAYLGLGSCFVGLALPGFWDMSEPLLYYYFIFIMILIGALNALLWPSFISILGHWFPKKSRGFLAGLWSTCNNSGNIIGIQLASHLMTNYFGNSWENLLLTIGFVVFAWAGIMFFWLVPEPELVGIKI